MNELYKTTDMALAATLSMNFPVKELQNVNGKGVFFFENTDELVEFINAYWNKQLQVEPIAYAEALKMIKNRLYNDVKNY
jgi:hypothetical protein